MFGHVSLRNLWWKGALVLLLVLLGGACHPAMVKPDKFARFKGGAFKAITADGVRVKVRSLPNEPYGDLKLWSGTVELHLKEQGYRLQKKEAVTSAGGPGQSLTALYGFRNRDYVYMVNVFVKGTGLFSRVILVEAAGPYEEFQKHEGAIRKSLETLKF